MIFKGERAIVNQIKHRNRFRGNAGEIEWSAFMDFPERVDTVMNWN